MLSTTQAQDLLANQATVVGQDDQKIGKIGQLYLDDITGEPNWVTVKTGLFGTKETFVPLDAATVSGEDTIRVPYTKDLIKDAPSVDVDEHLTPREEEQLYRHYSLSYEAAGVAGAPGAAGVAGAPGAAGTTRSPDATADSGTPGAPGAAGGAATDDAAGHDASVVRSEEQVDVGTRPREAGKARLRKHVVTDHVTKTVPVQREEVRVEREPIGGDAPAGAIGEDEAEVTLHEDEVVVEKEAKPVERVSVDADTVTEERTVESDVRKEQVDVETDENRR